MTNRRNEKCTEKLINSKVKQTKQRRLVGPYAIIWFGKKFWFQGPSISLYLPSPTYDLKCQLSNPECSFINLCVPEVWEDKGKVPGILCSSVNTGILSRGKVQKSRIVFVTTAEWYFLFKFSNPYLFATRGRIYRI